MSEIVITFHDGTTQVFDADTVRTVQHITTALVWTDGEPRPAPPTETLTQAVERVTTPPHYPTDQEMIEMAEEMDPEPSPHEIAAQRLDDFEAHYGRKATLQEATILLTTRKPRALETKPRAQPRSSCCGTLGRRMSRFGYYCAACQHHTDEDRAAMMMINTSFVKIVEGEE